MQVLKFGGTSVGSVESIKNVKSIIDDDQPKIIVLSAMSGTTNALVDIVKRIEDNDFVIANTLIQNLKSSYILVINDLLTANKIKAQALQFVDEVFGLLSKLIHQDLTAIVSNTILAQGELLSTFIFNCFLNQEGIVSSLLPALDFMRIDKDGEPDFFYIKKNIDFLLQANPNSKIYITQGFICVDEYGDISNLKRGGSDYTATIIGSVIEASEVQIWTDIDGMHNSDPRYVDNTSPISHISYDEAAELAYFGAKILHPQTVTPVRHKNIPVQLKNTMQPQAFGTLIDSNNISRGIKAIAAKDGITAIKIKSAKMLQAYGFLKKVFEIFEMFETSIDMITTSEIAVSLTVDNPKNLERILVELNKIAHIEVDSHQSIICMVGHSVVSDADTYKLFQILKDVDIRMISYGGSNNNISLLVPSTDKIKALKQLQNYVFSKPVLIT